MTGETATETPIEVPPDTDLVAMAMAIQAIVRKCGREALDLSNLRRQAALIIIEDTAGRVLMALHDSEGQKAKLLEALKELQGLAWGDVSGHSIEAYNEAKAQARTAIREAEP